MRLYSFLKNFANLTKSELMILQSEERVLVNGENRPLTTSINDNDIVTIDGKIIERIPFVYYLYNKPKGIICTNAKNISNSINSLNLDQKVFTVGRLDKESRGLIILTNDGEFSNLLISPKSHVEKEYIVTVKKLLTEEFLNNMSKSYYMDGAYTKEAIVKRIDDYKFSIILFEGKYHQIRRLVSMCGNYILDLERIRIGKYELNELKEGEIQKITR